MSQGDLKSDYRRAANQRSTGRPIGSALIDMKFQLLLEERLHKIRNDLPEDPEETAEKMMLGRFERIKCSFGSAVTAELPTIPLPIPGLPPAYTNEIVGISDSKMIITRWELRYLQKEDVDNQQERN